MDDRSHIDTDEGARGFLAALVGSAEDVIIGKDLAGRIVTWSHGAERLYGYKADEVKGRSIALLIPEDRAHELAVFLERIRAGDHIERYETVRRTKDGRLVDVSLTVSPVRDDTGTVLGAAVIAHDISRRKETELARLRSDLRWRSIVESAVDGIIVIDSRGIIESFNAGAERLFGYTEAEVVGQNVSILMPAPYRDEHDGYLARYLTTGAAKIIGIGREVSGLRRDGSVFPVRLSVGEMVLDGEHKFTGILHDLSARVQMEAQLREQAALARLGEMAAVIAHEVKNPLAGIRGAIQVIGSRLPSESREAAVTNDVIARIDALDALMKDLLLFARPPRPNLHPVDVQSIVRTTADLLAGDPSVAGIRVEVHGSVPRIVADAELLKILFVNLLVNSAHAMEGHGVIRVLLSADDGV